MTKPEHSPEDCPLCDGSNPECEYEALKTMSQLLADHLMMLEEECGYGEDEVDCERQRYMKSVDSLGEIYDGVLMSDKVWTQGVCDDGAALLKNGVMQTIEEVLDELNLNDKQTEIVCINCGYRMIAFVNVDQVKALKTENKKLVEFIKQTQIETDCDKCHCTDPYPLQFQNCQKHEPNGNCHLVDEFNEILKDYR